MKKHLTFLCAYTRISLYPLRKEVNRLGIHKGTKLTDNPKDFMLRVRLDRETLEQLDECCEAEQLSRSEIVRKGIKEQHGRMKK